MNPDTGVDGSRIAYFSDACVVINKLPGEAVEGAGQGMTDLSRILAAQFGGLSRDRSGKGEGPFFPAAVHRLDAPVSGCALFARTPKALAFLNAAFARGEIEKRYWAVIETPPPSTELPQEGELIHWLKTDTKRNKTKAYDEEKPDRKRALLRYRVCGQGEHYTFLEIELLTGRRHQIRAQLAALGLHIKGDLKYGSRRSEKEGGIRLHAFSLSFPNPLKAGETVCVKTLPPFMDPLWEAFAQSLHG
jgi:23S rRNA pseudouridine1911/1915/1917 synthase